MLIGRGRRVTAAPAQGGRRRVPLLPYLLVLPTFVFIAGFTIWPSLFTLYKSLYRHNQAVRVPRFVGLQNYRDLFNDPIFLRVVGNTIAFVLMTVPISIVLALLLALAIDRAIHGVGLLRLTFFYPTILPMVSAGTIWLFLYTPDYGLITELLRPLGLPKLNWLGTPDHVLWAIMIMAIWKQTGYYMIFYIAGLQNLPDDMLDAAKIDGASYWQSFYYITLPLLRETTFFITVIAVIQAFQTADQVYIMTGGGPDNASNLLLFRIYETNFQFQNYGMAYTMTVILVAIVMTLTTLNYFYNERRRSRDES